VSPPAAFSFLGIQGASRVTGQCGKSIFGSQLRIWQELFFSRHLNNGATPGDVRLFGDARLFSISQNLEQSPEFCVCSAFA